jgi:hypothetical protein
MLVEACQHHKITIFLTACLDRFKDTACEALIDDVQDSEDIYYQRGILRNVRDMRDLVTMIDTYKVSDTDFTALMNFGVIVKGSDNG